MSWQRKKLHKLFSVFQYIPYIAGAQAQGLGGNDAVLGCDHSVLKGQKKVSGSSFWKRDIKLLRASGELEVSFPLIHVTKKDPNQGSFFYHSLAIADIT